MYMHIPVYTYMYILCMYYNNVLGCSQDILQDMIESVFKYFSVYYST